MSKLNLSNKYNSKFSDYVRQNTNFSEFSTSESWVVLSEIEQRIKAKIEAVGTPLKDWDINIYRGILTGYNEAFIIDGKKKEEILSNCSTEEERTKTEQIIRPILRGRDIKRYGYDFADLWLINTHNGVKEKGIKPINIEDYPAVKKHLDSFYPQLEKRADKGDTPYNLRNCAYFESFFMQKIVWAETIKEYFNGSKNFPRFSFDSTEILLDKTCFMLLGDNLKFLLGILNSTVIEYFLRQTVVKLGAGSMGLSKIFIEQIPLIKPNKIIQQEVEKLVDEIEIYKNEDKPTILLETEIDKLIYEIYGLTDTEIEFIETQ